MATPELTRYTYEFGCLEESPRGTLCKVAEIEAYTQAAIAAAMMGAVKPLEWTEFRNDTWRAEFGYEICWNVGDEYRVRQNGKVILKTIKGFSRACEWVQRIHTARILSALSIPTDAMAALDAVMAQANHDGYDRCKERAAQLIEALFKGEGVAKLAAQIRAMEGSQLCE